MISGEATLSTERFEAELPSYGNQLVVWATEAKRLEASGPLYHKYAHDRAIMLGRLPEQPLPRVVADRKYLKIPISNKVLLSSVYTEHIYDQPTVHLANLLDLDQMVHFWLINVQRQGRLPNNRPAWMIYEGSGPDIEESTPLYLGDTAVRSWIERQSSLDNRQILERLADNL